MKLKGNKVELPDQEVDNKDLDAKIDKFSNEMTLKFKDMIQEVKCMTELMSPGKFSH